MAWLRAFLKCKFDHLLDIFLANFFINNWILQKEFYFCKFAKKLQILHDVSFVISCMYPGSQVPQQG